MTYPKKRVPGHVADASHRHGQVHFGAVNGALHSHYDYVLAPTDERNPSQNEQPSQQLRQSIPYNPTFYCGPSDSILHRQHSEDGNNDGADTTIISSIGEAQLEDLTHLFRAMETGKRRWRNFMNNSVRKARRFFCRRARGKGNCKGGMMMSGRGISSFGKQLRDEFLESGARSTRGERGRKQNPEAAMAAS